MSDENRDGLDHICQDRQRRHQSHLRRLNGIDYLEVELGPHGVTLTVFLLAKLNPDKKEKTKHIITRQNVLVLGGSRVRNIKVLDVKVCIVDGIENDDCLKIYLDRAGDFSTYTLCLVEADAAGRPIQQGTWQGKSRYKPLPWLDPRYACLDFTFRAACSSDLDCAVPKICPPEKSVEPEINYLAKDYASFRQLILDRMALLAPQWQERHIPDLGITLVELLAYVGDYLSYYQDAVATEAYLDTARRRISVRRHARLVDYVLGEGTNARSWVFVDVDNPTGPLSLDNFYFIAPYQANPLASGLVQAGELADLFPSGYEVFEPMAVDGTGGFVSPRTVSFYPGHNEIHFYTWGDRECCLPRGATTASLRGPIRPMLKPGDFLLFEEVLGPTTGNPADADWRHRHVVRLTEVREEVDPLNYLPVVEIAWHPADALPFPLCLSTIAHSAKCEYLCDITLARGNLVLVDHGRTVQDDLAPVPPGEVLQECLDEGEPVVTGVRLPDYRPALRHAPLVFSQPLPRDDPASRLLDQKENKALPAVTHLQDSLGYSWIPQHDLLSSQAEQRHFVVEIDDDRRAHLRFGDGELGHAPAPESSFSAQYRVGGGPAGNVGAQTIKHIVFRSTLGGVAFTPRNPLPAVGGRTAETTAHARLMAPEAIRTDLARAITPEDYARIAEREFPGQLQRAAATLRWTGSWYEMLVALDAWATAQPDPQLAWQVYRYLRRFRRIGHDLVVQLAQPVPIDLTLEVCLQPHALRGQVKRALLEVLGSRVRPDGQPGYFHPDNLSFGEAVLLSRILAAAQAVEGVESVTVTKFQRSFTPANNEIEDGMLPLGPMEIARLDNDPSSPENGKLELIVRGGR